MIYTHILLQEVRSKGRPENPIGLLSTGPIYYGIRNRNKFFLNREGMGMPAKIGSLYLSRSETPVSAVARGVRRIPDIRKTVYTEDDNRNNDYQCTP